MYSYSYYCTSNMVPSVTPSVTPAVTCDPCPQLDCNVICVHWDKGAATPNYMRAAVNTRLVGRQVAILIKQLVNR